MFCFILLICLIASKCSIFWHWFECFLCMRTDSRLNMICVYGMRFEWNEWMLNKSSNCHWQYDIFRYSEVKMYPESTGFWIKWGSEGLMVSCNTSDKSLRSTIRMKLWWQCSLYVEITMLIRHSSMSYEHEPNLFLWLHSTIV